MTTNDRTENEMTEQSTTPEPRYVGMHTEGEREYRRFSDGTTVGFRRDWTPDDAARELVVEWLNPPVVVAAEGDGAAAPVRAAHREVAQQARFIRENGKTLGVLISAEEYEEGRNAIYRINEDAYGAKDEAYKPFQHAPQWPLPDRLINTDVLERIIRDAIHGKDADITREEQDKIHYRALVAALEFSFDPDSRGIVPVMTPGRATDGTTNEFYWSFLYPTKVPGLYLRPDDDIIGGTNYTLTCGSGYALVGGFWDREYAEELAVKLGEAMPGMNWFTLKQSDLTDDLTKTAVGIIREHGRFRKDDA